MAFMDSLKKTLNEEFETSVTENGALGYRTAGKALLDLNFMVTSLRNKHEDDILCPFIKAFYEDKLLAIKWLFFASDVREGLGERRLFRVIMRYLAKNQPEIARALLPLIPEYSRFDNFLCLLDTELCDDVVSLIQIQLEKDMEQMAQNNSISLCAKWMPSVNASSKEARRFARILVDKLSLTERQYRKMLSKLRSYLHVVEVSMSKKEWDTIDYSAVPSRANLIYNNAFLRNDEQRRRAFLEKVKSGKQVIHSDVLYPHDIIHRYFDMSAEYWRKNLLPEDDTLESLWRALPDYIKQHGGNTLCVSDGSGSMLNTIGNTNICCLEVANALSIYFAEHASGEFKDKYITFSTHPQFVDFSNAHSLREKIEIARAYDEVSNTDIEAVFELILLTAVKNHLPQREMPKNILILSDMEFDMATHSNSSNLDEKLFSGLQKRYQEKGYQLPRLVFWNICSRTSTIPLQTNPLGIALVSGFSPTIMKMVLSGETDPYQCMLNQLKQERYQAVEDAIKNLIA